MPFAAFVFVQLTSLRNTMCNSTQTVTDFKVRNTVADIEKWPHYPQHDQATNNLVNKVNPKEIDQTHSIKLKDFLYKN